MAVVLPQTGFNLITPTQNNDGSPAPTGEVTQYDITVNGVAYTFAAPASWTPGSTQRIPFASMVPVFTPSAGTAYAATIASQDANGEGLPSAAYDWTQAAAVPNPPTGFSAS